MKNQQPTYIHVDNGSIKYGFYVYYEQKSETQWSISVPAYNISFSTRTKEEGVKRAKVAVRSFYHMWLSKEGWKRFVLEIHRLGFRAEAGHDMVMSKLLKRQPIVVNLNSMHREGGELIEEQIAA
jgi:hypothetical protein